MNDAPLWTALTEVDRRAGDDADSLPLLSVSKSQGVVRYSDLFPDRAVRAQEHRHYKTAQKDDIVLNKMSAATGAVGLSPEAGLVSPDYAVLRAGAHSHPGYLTYVLGSKWFCGDVVAPMLRGIGAGDASSVRTPRVSIGDYLAARVQLPSFDVQRRLAGLLDRETAEIDAMDAELNHLTQTLQERDLQQHQAAVDLAGFPSAALGHLADVTLGKMLDQKKNVGDPSSYIRAANITKSGVVSLEDVKVMPMTKLERNRLDLRRDDTVMIEGGDAGRVAYLSQDLVDISFQKTVLRIRPRLDVVDGRYLYVALRQAHRSGRIAVDHSVSTIPHFTAEKTERLQVPVPPRAEQRWIAAELDEQTARIDDMIADTQKLKNLLAERRSTLITDVVTGKKEVPA